MDGWMFAMEQMDWKGNTTNQASNQPTNEQIMVLFPSFPFPKPPCDVWHKNAPIARDVRGNDYWAVQREKSRINF